VLRSGLGRLIDRSILTSCQLDLYDMCRIRSCRHFRQQNNRFLMPPARIPTHGEHQTKNGLAVSPNRRMLKSMKTVMTIIFSLLLAVAPWLSAQAATTGSGVTQVAAKHCACCPEGVPMPCCAAKSATSSQPEPVAVAPAGASLPLLILQPAFSIVTLPQNTSGSVCSVPEGLLSLTATPLFQRNCVLLI